MAGTAVHYLAYAHGYGDVQLFRWLWGYLHWWAVPVFTAWVAFTVFLGKIFRRDR